MLALQRERAADAVAPAALALGWGPEALLRPPAWRRDESELHALVRSHRHVVAAALDRAFIDGNFLGRAGARAEHNVRRVLQHAAGARTGVRIETTIVRCGRDVREIRHGRVAVDSQVTARLLASA